MGISNNELTQSHGLSFSFTPIDENILTVYIVYIQIGWRLIIVKLIIDNRSGHPIYDQIYNQLRDQIINGTLAEDESLPSIRTLAKDLRISVITTKRSYEELEREGYIYTIPGKGSFVAGKNVQLIEEHLAEIKKLSVSCNLSQEEVTKMMKVIWDENV